jgi:hypothetical protein
MTTFSVARLDAAKILEELNLDEVSSESQRVFQQEIEWLKDRRLAMRLDILSSAHLWSLEDSPGATCARTNVPDNPQAVYLSLPACRRSLLTSGLGEVDAIRMLIHESSHHFGLREAYAHEEDLARTVSIAAYKIWVEQRERRQPFWAEIPLSAQFGWDFAPRMNHAAALAVSLKGDSWLSSAYIFGGCTDQKIPGTPGCSRLLGDGARYVFENHDPRQGRWEALPKVGAPGPRRHHQLTTAEQHAMVILTGGCPDVDTACSNASNETYALSHDEWVQLPSMPVGRGRHAAVWADENLIVYGGLRDGLGLGDAYILRSKANEENKEQKYEWWPLQLGVQTEGRFDPSVFWTGNSLIVFGGCAELRLGTCRRPLMDGFVFTPLSDDPTQGQWRKLTAPEHFEAREGMSVVWTGRYLIVWGGRRGTQVFSDGAILDFESTNLKWQDLPRVMPVGEPGRFQHHAVWDGARHRMLLVGGRNSTALTRESFAKTVLTLTYDQQRQSWHWASIRFDRAPVPKVDDSLFGFFDMALSWGGFSAEGFLSGSGYVFMP